MSPTDASPPPLTSSPSPSAVRGAPLVLLAATLWGLWSVVFRAADAVGGAAVPASMQTLVAFLVQAVVFVPLAWRARCASTMRQRGAGWLLLMGAFDAANALCFFSAMQFTTVGVAVLCHSLAPLLVALVAPVLLGETWRWRTVGLALVATAGVVLLLDPSSTASSSSSSSSLTSSSSALGATLALLSAVFYAASFLLAKHLMPRYGAIGVAAWPKLSALVVLAIAAVVTAPASGAPISLASLVVLGVGALGCAVLPTMLFNTGLGRLRAGQAGILTLMEPLVAVAVGVSWWGEPLTPRSVLGGVLILLAAGTIAAPPPSGLSTTRTLS